MKQACIKIFSFRPEDFRQMEQYLNKMLEQGWRLRWCKGTLAGFERTDNKDLHYTVDPYAVSSPSNFRRFPKFRLNEYMENGWYAIGKSKGCYVFCSDNPNPQMPDLDEDLRENVIKTSYIGSVILAIILSIILIKSISTPAILYSILLTDIYIVLTGLVLFLILYHVMNIIFLLATKKQSDPRQGCIRYIVHDVMIFIFLILALFLQARHESSMMNYLLLPILVVVIGSIILIIVSKKTKSAQESNKRLIPVICVMSLILFILIPLSVHRLQEKSSENKKIRAEELLTEVELLPVAHLSDFVSVPSVKNAIKENKSILGDNLLYAEEYEDLSVFTNRTEMKSDFFAKPIFNYLFTQTQKEQNQSFEENTFHGITYYSLKTANTILWRDGTVVYLCTAPSSVPEEMVLDLLLSY
ncbi:DUF2812 domain-containing protein [Anaerotignum sp.]|uniref:DUF2812 domain-containing protein n=1 Tax=Anaerotignum sp. TaxID=2039241 RepID=UPI00331BC449